MSAMFTDKSDDAQKVLSQLATETKQKTGLFELFVLWADDIWLLWTHSSVCYDLWSEWKD